MNKMYEEYFNVSSKLSRSPMGHTARLSTILVNQSSIETSKKSSFNQHLGLNKITR